MYNKCLYIFLANFSLIINLYAENNYPSLLDVKIGQEYDYQGPEFELNNHRPFTQFMVPNHGETKKYFPEYQVVLSNSNRRVSNVSAELVIRDYKVCNNIRSEIKPLIENKFPQHYKKNSFRKKTKAVDINKYVKGNNNTFYVLSCRGSYGPFATLHFGIRGEKEDQKMKEDFENFFSSKD